MRLTISQPLGPLHGDLLIPSSKYHAHRALILGSLAKGTTTIHGLSDARHVSFTLGALAALGTKVTTSHGTSQGTWKVEGGQYSPVKGRVPFGSSGTTSYFLTPLACLADRPVVVDGQSYLRNRPVGPLLEALRTLGVELEASPGEKLPIAIQPGRPRGGHVKIKGTLSQWISGLLILAPFCREKTTIEVVGELNEQPYVQLTVEMMEQFGLHVNVLDNWQRFEIEPGQEPHATEITLPADVGSAVFGIAAAALHPSDVRFIGLTESTDHPEGGIYRVLREMNVPLVFDESTRIAQLAQRSPELRGTEVDCREMPDMLPILSVLGSFAHGRTVLRNVNHVRLKESDRVEAMLQLAKMGARIHVEGDSLICEGDATLAGRTLSSFNDHRVLMSLSIAGSRASGLTAITYPHAYRISYPEYLEAMTSIGIPMTAPGFTPRHFEGAYPAYAAAAAAREPLETAAREGTRATDPVEAHAPATAGSKGGGSRT